jgi:chorismate mutase
VLPDHLRYVKRVASYRKAHASPLADPKVIAQMLESVRANDPEFADQIAESGGQSQAAMARMIAKYGE